VLFLFRMCLPLIPGDYKFDLLIKNPVSREFSSFSQKLQLPARTKAPEIGPIRWLSTRLKPEIKGD
jgi:hypothetical protein